ALMHSADTPIDTLTRPAASGASSPKAANKPPTVTLTSPVSGAVFSAGSSIILTATATDPDGSLARVEFYRGGTALIGTATSPPYQFAWTNVAAGNYSLTAKAYDNRNATATSATATIAVMNNQPPVVTLASPSSGAFFAVGSTVRLTATASDPDGTVANVEFFDGGTSIGAIGAAPYEIAWMGA